MIEAEMSGDSIMHYNAAIFGPRPQAEYQNPDGTMVRATSLRGSMGLYIDLEGAKVEATAACTEFIAQLRSLIQAGEAVEKARSEKSALLK
jgi:hypothetical protein